MQIVHPLHKQDLSAANEATLFKHLSVSKLKLQAFEGSE